MRKAVNSIVPVSKVSMVITAFNSFSIFKDPTAHSSFLRPVSVWCMVGGRWGGENSRKCKKQLPKGGMSYVVICRLVLSYVMCGGNIDLYYRTSSAGKGRKQK